jgi:hypothetical protein
MRFGWKHEAQGQRKEVYQQMTQMISEMDVDRQDTARSSKNRISPCIDDDPTCDVSICAICVICG